MRDNHFSVSWPSFLAGAGIFLVLTFTMLMPDISESLTGAHLLLFWSTHIFGALIILQGVQMLLIRLRSFSEISPWLQVLFSGLIGAVLFTPIAGALDQMFGIEGVPDDQIETLTETLLGEFTGSVGIVTVVWVGLNATRLVQTQQMRTPEATTIRATQTPAFWDCVPGDIGRELVAMSAELHYIQIYTTKGKALILFPFGQAVKQLAGSINGLQIHRSHWVSLSHIENLERRGQGGLCLMSTGLQLPVSRRYMKDIRNGLPSEQ